MKSKDSYNPFPDIVDTSERLASETKFKGRNVLGIGSGIVAMLGMIGIAGSLLYGFGLTSDELANDQIRETLHIMFFGSAAATGLGVVGGAAASMK